LTAVPAVLVILTAPWNPFCHRLVTEYATVHPPAGAWLDDAVGLDEADGRVDVDGAVTETEGAAVLVGVAVLVGMVVAVVGGGAVGGVHSGPTGHGHSFGTGD
jgi:hypothetical protein